MIWQLPRDPPARLAGGARNVLTWITFGLAIWLSVGALIALLFGAFVSGQRPWWELDEDDSGHEQRRTAKSDDIPTAPPIP